jgi:Putative viral replication protein.
MLSITLKMAHLAHQDTVKNCRNTKGIDNLKSRGWAFTLNNYSEEEVKAIQNIPRCEYVFQEETGPSGTPHLRGGYLL